MLNHASLFVDIADASPSRPCINSGSRTATYGDVKDRASRLANVLLRSGITIQRPRTELQPWESGQDHVALYLHNGIEYIEGTVGAALARAASFNVNYRYVADELAYLLNDAGAAAIIYHAAFAPTLADVLPRLHRKPLLLQVVDQSGNPLIEGAADYDAALAAAPAARPDTSPHPDDLHLLYTGGTTGMPKGTLWTQGALFDATVGRGIQPLLDGGTAPQAIPAALAGVDPTSYLPLPPLMHGAALWLALTALLSGGTLVFPDVVETFDPASAWAAVARERVSVISVVGDAFARPLCDELERATHDTSSLLAFMSGGAALSPKIKERLVRLLPGVAVIDGAGASETGAHLSGVGSDGTPLPQGVFLGTPDTHVLDEDLSEVVAPGHEGPGWLARSSNIPLGYLGDEAKTRRTFPVVDGVRMVVPGDRARLLADGTIELLGRDAATINSGGEKIFAEEVELVLLGDPAIDDALVIGRASDRWGQEVVAVVQLADAADPTDEAILERASAALARYKLPKELVRVDRVVRSPSGKADYAWARSLVDATVEYRQPS